MARKKPIISPLGQWAYPGEVTIIPSSKITMKGVNYPVLGVDDLGNSKVMMPGAEYDFPGNYVTEYPQMNKGGQMIKRKDGSYSQRGLWDNIRANKGSGKKPTKEMLEQERKIKAKMQNGGWLDQYQVGGPETSTEQNPERMQGVNINVKRKKVSDNPTYQYDNQGNLLYKPDINISPYLLDNSTRDSFWVNPKLPIKNLNPTVEELRQVAAPYYPIDNKLVTDPKLTFNYAEAKPSNYQESLEQEYVLPEVVGKSFGNFPLVKDDGYSPNRRWITSLRNGDKLATGYRNDSGIRAYGPNKYAYVLKTDPNNLVNYPTKDKIENDLSLNNKVFYDYLAKNNYSPDTVDGLTRELPDQIWNRAAQMQVEMRNNPEIMSWANLHNLDLGYKPRYEDSEDNDDFAPKIPESIYAARLAKAGLPTNRPDYDYDEHETYIAQDPSKFSLVDYFPVDPFLKDAKNNPKNKKDEWGNVTDDQALKKQMAKRMGIDPSAFDNGEYLIHYNKSPITEYTPGKKYGGWLEQYQSGGSFMNAIKIAMTPELRGFVGNQLVDKGVSKVAQKVGDVSKQQLFERYRPVDYPDPVGAFFNMGKDVPLRDLEGDYHISEEAWRLALGLPTESKYISPSKYKPTKADDPNAQYYSLNNVYDPQKLINAYIEKAHGKPGQSVQMNALSPYLINKDRMVTDNEMPFTETDPLQNFTLSQGEDAKGRYISIYDKYDFNVPYMDDVVYGSNRKPYEFYDRFYYKKDANGRPVYVKQKKDGGQTNWLDKYK